MFLFSVGSPNVFLKLEEKERRKKEKELRKEKKEQKVARRMLRVSFYNQFHLFILK